MANSFSNYIVYVDESGDANLTSIRQDYPVLSLAFCIFNKREYSRKIISSFSEFKFCYWGHDAIVLHEAEVRKNWSEKYGNLVDPEVYEIFLADLKTLINQTDFHIIASVIHKSRLKSKYLYPTDPYALAVLFSMELLLKWLVAKGEAGKTVHVIFESRSTREDGELSLAFHRIINDFDKIKFVPFFARKSANHTGLQIADLIARPIGLSIIRPHQPNRTHAIIRRKFIGNSPKVFPEDS